MAAARRPPTAVRIPVDRSERREGGFTLVEMVIAIAISAAVFTATAGVLASGLKTLAVQKARSQGNEVATQGIEDLQRYAYKELEICGQPSGAVPGGLTMPVLATSTTKCPTAVATTGDEPCTPPTGTPLMVPKAQYSCQRANITFTVRRYVAWTDAGQTSKRLAVYVRWTDAVGTHDVSQQSSLRAPVSGDIIGIPPPTFPSAPTVTPASRTNTIDAIGTLTSASITFSVQVAGLTDFTNDRVYVSFRSLEAGSVVTTTQALTYQSATSRWTGTLPSGGPTLFPSGSQYFSFTAVRAADGKTGSVVDSASSTFCPCSATPPSFTLTSGRVAQSVTSVAIDSTGAIKASNGGGTGTVTLTATTQQLTSFDSLSFQFMTTRGMVSSAMTPVGTCDGTSPDCVWTGTISAAAGYGFDPGVQSIYFLAAKTTGATAAAQSSDITFVTS